MGPGLVYRLLGRDPVQLKVAEEGPTVFFRAVRSLSMIVFPHQGRVVVVAPFWD